MSIVSLNSLMKKVYDPRLQPRFAESDRAYAMRVRPVYDSLWTLEEQHASALGEEEERNNPTPIHDLDPGLYCDCPDCTGSHPEDK